MGVKTGRPRTKLLQLSGPYGGYPRIVLDEALYLDFVLHVRKRGCVLGAHRLHKPTGPPPTTSTSVSIGRLIELPDAGV